MENKIAKQLNCSHRHRNHLKIMSGLVGASFASIFLVVLVSLVLNSVIVSRTETTLERIDALLPAPLDVQESCSVGVDTNRRQRAYAHRISTAAVQNVRAVPCHFNNGDEALYASTRAASFTKGLPHDLYGHVSSSAYNQLLRAVQTGSPADYDAIPLDLNATRKLTNPQAANALTLEGADSQTFSQPPPPTFASAEQGAEMIENYAMALLRDVNFDDYGTNPLATTLIADLNAVAGAYNGTVPITAGNLFRGTSAGCLVGPYLSQFFYQPCPFGAMTIDMRIKTSTAGIDFMTNYSEWLAVQRGWTPSSTLTFSPTPVYMRNGRDLGQFVHVDVLYEAYFNAMLVLFTINAPLKPNIPYVTTELDQMGFGTFGAPFITSLLAKVAETALKTVWFQKFIVHRRMRPELFAGRIHLHKTGTYTYSPPPHNNVLNSAALAQVFANTGTYLLPQAYPEGSPLHPSYGAGHATVAGACVTILKAFFVEETVIASPLRPSSDGLTTIPFVGPDLTVIGELNKIAWNVAVGRNFGGVHWRSDAIASLQLGQDIAVEILRDIRGNYPEPFTGYSFTGFNGETVVV